MALLDDICSITSICEVIFKNATSDDYETLQESLLLKDDKNGRIFDITKTYHYGDVISYSSHIFIVKTTTIGNTPNLSVDSDTYFKKIMKDTPETNSLLPVGYFHIDTYSTNLIGNTALVRNSGIATSIEVSNYQASLRPYKIKVNLDTNLWNPNDCIIISSMSADFTDLTTLDSGPCIFNKQAGYFEYYYIEKMNDTDGIDDFVYEHSFIIFKYNKKLPA